MADQTAVERVQRYRQRKREEAQRHIGKVLLRGVYVSPAASAMLAIISEQYGDPSEAVEEAIRQLHAQHYRRVSSDVPVTSRSDRPKPTPRGHAPEPGQADRRAALVRRIKELHAGGETANAIASRLNREGEATLTGRGQWRHKLVQALIDEAG